MAKATITFSDEDEGTLSINVDFDPPFNNTEGSENPTSHVAVMISLEAVTEALGLTAA